MDQAQGSDGLLVAAVAKATNQSKKSMGLSVHVRSDQRQLFSPGGGIIIDAGHAIVVPILLEFWIHYMVVNLNNTIVALNNWRQLWLDFHFQFF